MRLISMERDGNLAAVYERLVKVVQEIEKKLEFLRCRRLGFLTFCSTNLGTAIPAFVLVHLPKFSGILSTKRSRSSGKNFVKRYHPDKDNSRITKVV
ncbi:PREDICTED: arginine kinase-like [Acromyrmex echinatior]|uniref:arginine kinase-like n=1 Tax=Acromyrmex echinatior TaxID=103372 RepID=UPI000580BFDB|nr:PREDICTED: arginine kinase-like [Acromyrmex echinatior]XP_011062104.1 PREDICTED: arginine kinase-like [Acromyrmex echinatior]XP_011062105.1 PREDICTED: arginine kinase-like [Acromyrmex echinatior]